MKALALLFIVYLCAACNRNGGDQYTPVISPETRKMITTTEDSLRMMDELMQQDTGMSMTKKMDLMHQQAGMIEKNTGMLMRDTMMWMDAEMNRMKDSLAMLDAHMATGKMNATDAMKMMEEKKKMLVQQWVKTKGMKQQMEEMQQISSTKMNRKNR